MVSHTAAPTSPNSSNHSPNHSPNSKIDPHIHLLEPHIRGWRDALERLRHDATRAGWRQLRAQAEAIGCPRPLWGSLYARTVLQRGVFQAALLAVLEESGAKRDTTLAHIAAVAYTAVAGPPYSPARPLSDFEHRIALTDATSSPPGAFALCIDLARAYAALDETQPAPGTADVLLDQARRASTHGDHAAMHQLVARAGALALRGDIFWDGWLREGPTDFQSCCVVLITCLDWVNLMGLAPLAAPATQHATFAELCAAITDRYGQTRRSTPNQSEHEAPHAPIPLQDLLVEIAAIIRNGGLAADHPARRSSALRNALSAGVLALCHARAEIETFGPGNAPNGTITNEDEDDMLAAMAQLEADCIVALGYLHYTTPDALNTLLHRAVDPDLHPAIGQAAVWALQQIGASSLPAARATMRYSSNPYARKQAQLIFGAAGRGHPEVFDELARAFNDLRWQDGRADLALPLALTEDPRAVSMLIAALATKPPTSSDVSAVLEALDQLDIAWHWVPETSGIDLPLHGRIDGLAGLSLPPPFGNSTF